LGHSDFSGWFDFTHASPSCHSFLFNKGEGLGSWLEFLAYAVHTRLAAPSTQAADSNPPRRPRWFLVMSLLFLAALAPRHTAAASIRAMFVFKNDVRRLLPSRLFQNLGLGFVGGL